jgi:hypothetical protein
MAKSGLSAALVKESLSAICFPVIGPLFLTISRISSWRFVNLIGSPPS